MTTSRYMKYRLLNGDPIFTKGYKILFAWGCTGKEFEEIVLEETGAEIDCSYSRGHTEEVVNQDGETLWLVYVKDIGSLSHECIHLTNFIFAHVGLSYDMNNDEALAYYQEYWLERLSKIIEESADFTPDKAVKSE